MRRLRSWLLRLVGAFGGGRRDHEIAEELRTHSDLLAEDYTRSGMTPEAARRRAGSEFGSVASAAETYRDRRGLPTLDRLGRDVRYAARLLARRPGFAATAILTLALAIGANVAIFNLIDRVVLHPLDVPDPSGLLTVERGVETRTTSLIWEQADQFRGMSTLANVAIASSASDVASKQVLVSAGGGDAADAVDARFITANYFRVLGLAPALGRDFDPFDDTGTAPPVVLLSHRFWRERFGGEVTAIGRTVRINGSPVAIVGVAPRTFTGTDFGAAPPDIFLPLLTASRLATDTGNQTNGRGMFSNSRSSIDRSPVSPVSSFVVVARATRGKGEHAKAEVAARLGSGNWSLVPLIDTMLPFASRADLRQFLYLLAGAVGLTLLIGCANLASLLLARIDERRVELAVRAALGASRARLVQQLAVEAGLLAVAGGAVALLVAGWIDQGLSAFMLPGGVAVSNLRSGFDGRTLAFAAFATTLAASVTGIAPAVRGARQDLLVDIRTGAGSSRLGVARLLLAVQVTVCIVLTFGAVLFVRTLSNGLATDLGFEARGLVSASIYVDPKMGARALTAIDALVERARTLPGVTAVTAGPLPLVAGNNVTASRVRVDGVATNLSVDQVWVAPDYFTTLGVRFLAGRDFDERDRDGGRLVAVVNEAAARRLWNGGAALDHQIAIPGPPRMPDTAPGLTVVGVVRDVRIRNLKETGRPVVYLARLQHQMFLSGFAAGSRSAFLIVRANGDPSAVAPSLSAMATEAGLSLRGLTTVGERMREMLMPQRLGRALLLLLGAMALVLTIVGIYGLTACLVARHAKEIGVRLALGAGRRDIVRTIGNWTLRPIIAGVACASVLVWFGGRFADPFLYGMKGSDLTTLGITIAAIAGTGVLAAVVPTRRALRINPIDTLRAD